MTNDEIKTRIRTAFEALSAGKPQPYLDLFANDIVWRVTGSSCWSGTYHGKETLVNTVLRPVSRRIQGHFKAKVVQVVVDGDRVVVESKGDNMTRAGKRYDNEYCWVCRIEDGQFVEVTEYADTELFTSAIGPETPAA